MLKTILRKYKITKKIVRIERKHKKRIWKNDISFITSIQIIEFKWKKRRTQIRGRFLPEKNIKIQKINRITKVWKLD